MKFYFFEFLVQVNRNVEIHFGFVYTFFCSKLQESSNFTAKNETVSDTNALKKNGKILPKQKLNTFYVGSTSLQGEVTVPRLTSHFYYYCLFATHLQSVVV